LKQSPEGTEMQFCIQPFTYAFSTGCWLLLDELNLAPDAVLQCLETSLESKVCDPYASTYLKVLFVRDPSSVQDFIKRYDMHPDFRLFATQNPNLGMFKGKRERLSSSFLSRFRPLAFTELPGRL
jgi:midasin (ATPase involved in ribosome maturation)